MHSQLIRPCRTLICTTLESWWRSLARWSYAPGPLCSDHDGWPQFCASQTTRVNACHCSLNPQNLWVITAWSAVVWFRPLPPTLGLVINTEGFCESWKLSCISVCSWLPISEYIWNMSTWSAKYFVSQHCMWRTMPGQGRNSTDFGGVDALRSKLWFLSCAARSTTRDVSSWSGSGYSACWWRSTGRNVYLTHGNVKESTQIPLGYSMYHRPDRLLRLSVSPYANEINASLHLWILHAPEPPGEVCLSTRVFSFGCCYWLHLRTMRWAFNFSIRTSGCRWMALVMLWCGSAVWLHSSLFSWEVCSIFINIHFHVYREAICSQ